jgi:hypothetical protein
VANRVTQLVVEVVVPIPFTPTGPVLSQVVLEVTQLGVSPPVRLTQALVEVIQHETSGALPINTQMVLEVICGAAVVTVKNHSFVGPSIGLGRSGNTSFSG